MFPFPAARVSVAQPVVRHGKIGIEGNFFAQLLDGAVDLGPIDGDFTQNEIRLGKFRLARQSFLQLRLGVVFEFLAHQHLRGEQMGGSGIRRYAEQAGKRDSSLLNIARLQVGVPEHVE